MPSEDSDEQKYILLQFNTDNTGDLIDVNVVVEGINFLIDENGDLDKKTTAEFLSEIVKGLEEDSE